MAPEPTLYDALQADFPTLDTSLLAALLADIQLDCGGNPSSPTSEQIKSLRITLGELAAQAERDEHHQLSAEDIDTTDDAPDFCSGAEISATTPSSSSSPSSSSASSSSASSSSCHSFSTPLGFLQAALPHIPTSKLRNALGGDIDGDDNDADIDMEAIIDTLLTAEYIRELEERGLADDEDAIDVDNSWQIVEAKKPSPNSGKRKKANGKAKAKTIALADIRQQHHIRRRPAQPPTFLPAPDPWTQLASLSTHLATLLPPHTASFFSSYFHDPNHATPAKALRAALTSVADPTPTYPSTVLSNLLELLRASPTYDALSYAQRTQLPSDAHLCLAAAHGRADDALDLVGLLQDLESDSDAALEMGVYHSPVPTSPPGSTPWARRPSLSSIPFGPPPTPPARNAKPPPPTASTQKPPPNAWQSVPPRKPPPGPHPLAASIPGYAASSRNGTAIWQRRAEERRASESLRKRDELLRQATRAWVRGSKATRGGEVALFYAERAREFQELARKETLDDARRRVEQNRLASVDRTTIDLHGTTVSEAVTIVKEILGKEGASAAKPLKIITGRGTHSANRVGVLKPAVRAALVESGWSVGTWEGGLVVRGKGGAAAR